MKKYCHRMCLLVVIATMIYVTIFRKYLINSVAEVGHPIVMLTARPNQAKLFIPPHPIILLTAKPSPVQLFIPSPDQGTQHLNMAKFQKNRTMHTLFKRSNESLFGITDVKNVPRIQNQTKIQILSNAKIVLIIAYLRTGSTLTGGIFKEYPGAFYLFEPIRSPYNKFVEASFGRRNIVFKYPHSKPSRYAQAYPTINQTAHTTAKVLFESFVLHYGFPARIHSDQGRNFESGLIKELCNIAAVEKMRTTPYHPMGNGMVERFNQTLLKMLGTLEEEQKSNWKSHVPVLIHAYNATHHDSTGYSPYFFMFARHPRLAIDAFLGLPTDPTLNGAHTEYVVKLRDRLKTAYTKARQQATKTSATDKKTYDMKTKNVSLQPNDRVLVRNVSRQMGRTSIRDRITTRSHSTCIPSKDGRSKIQESTYPSQEPPAAIHERYRRQGHRHRRRQTYRWSNIIQQEG